MGSQKRSACTTSGTHATRALGVFFRARNIPDQGWQMGVPTFVVGTGRCGSTMLSNVLREHPKVLSLSEFFPGITDSRRACVAQALSSTPIDGPHFWEIVAGIKALGSHVLR